MNLYTSKIGSCVISTDILADIDNITATLVSLSSDISADYAAKLNTKRNKTDMFTEWVFSDGVSRNLYLRHISSGLYIWTTDATWDGEGQPIYYQWCGYADSEDVTTLELTWPGPDQRPRITATRSRILTTADVADEIATAVQDGKLADAKKVAEALAGKLDSVSSAFVLGGIGFGNDAVGYFYKKDDVTPFATNAYGNIFSFPATNKGNGVLALTSDIAAATKLTPVRDSSGATVGYKLGAKTAEDDPTLNGMSVEQITTLAETVCKNKLSITDSDFKTAVETIVNEILGKT